VSAKLVIFWHVTMMAFFFPSLVSMGLFNLAWGWSFIRTPKCTSKGGRISGGECVTGEFCSDDGHALADGWSLKKKKTAGEHRIRAARATKGMVIGVVITRSRRSRRTGNQTTLEHTVAQHSIGVLPAACEQETWMWIH